MVKILDDKYEKANILEVIRENCKHLTVRQQVMLVSLLTEFETLFDGTLGDWKTSPVKLELRKGMRPFHGRAYPVPVIHKETLKKEVKRLEKLGVLKWEGASEWGSPTFIMQKKMGQCKSCQILRKSIKG